MSMKSNKIYLFFLLLLSVLLITAEHFAEGEKSEKNSLRKIQGSPSRAYMNINNVSTLIQNDGNSDIDPSGNSGAFFPKGSGKAAVFESGFLWGARIEGDPQVRVGGSAYRQGLQPGKILPDGTPEDPELDKNRIYRVRPDIYPGGPAVDLSGEAIDEGSSADAIRAQYELDWVEWPAADGAEYDDVDGDGTYNSDVDIPGVAGADQTIWFVANDLDPTITTFLYGAQPLGIEMQATFWAYAQTGALGNTFFRKYKLINKSQTDFLDMYLSMWSDVDLGNASDDFAGCDTTLSLGYCYNAQANDATYNPLPPPAVGFDFFQGPLLDGIAGEDRNKNGVDDATDFGIFGGENVGPGKINLPMTAFYYFARGDATVVDPTQGDPQGSTQFYNFFQGKVGLTGDRFVDPNTNLPSSYVLTGDPQTRTGWIDGQQLPGGDRRIGSASGPFTMAVGDTQEVVVAEIFAGAIEGVDRISAIGLLKFYDQQAQLAYDNFFNLPVPPKAPEVTVVETDNGVVLNWSDNSERVTETESTDDKGFVFQGYNVYQLPSTSADVSSGVRIATFDVDDGIGKIKDDIFDTKTGEVVNVPVQFGNDTRIKRYLKVTTDALKGGTPLINGVRYYFAVTSYSYNPNNVVPNNLENPLQVITVVPNSANPGVRNSYEHGEIVDVSHSGGSDGSVTPIVLDPAKLTGDTYEVTFDVTDGETTWNLSNTTKSVEVLTGQTNQSGDDEYKNVDGMLVKVLGPPPGVKQSDMFVTDDASLWGWDIPQGTRRFTWGNADGFEWEGFRGAIGYGSPHGVFGPGPEPIAAAELKNVLLILARVPDTTSFENPSIDPNDPNVSYGYRFGRGFGDPPARPEFAPYILSSATDGYTFQDFTKSVPLSAWDIEDPDNPRRLALGYLENNAEFALLDGRWWPGDNNGYNNTAGDGPREWLFIFDEDYSETPNASYTDVINDPVPVMYWLTVNRRGKVPFSYDLETGVGESGDDHFSILANKINIPDDVFSFVASATTFTAEDAKADIEKLNVFPNPYYAVNSEELNKYNRFVTFTHLPDKATIRIFNLAGVHVKTIEKDDNSQFQRWDLANTSGLPVASGLYIAYVDMPGIGETKILKVAIIQEQQILDRF